MHEYVVPVVLLAQVVHVQPSFVGGNPKTLLTVFDYVVDVVATQAVGVALVMNVTLDNVAFSRFRGYEPCQPLRLRP